MSSELIQETAQIESLLTQLDAAQETASPDILEPEETAGLAEIDESETQGPEDEAEAENTGDVRALQRRGFKNFTPQQALYLMNRGTRRGKKKLGKAIARTSAKRPQGHQVRLTKAELSLNEAWQKKGVPYVVQEGFYYYAVPIEFEVEGDPKGVCWARLKAGKHILFDKAVGDAFKLFGKDFELDLRMTNYSRPSKKAAASYHGQDMVIKGISMRDTGFRVQYDSKDIAATMDAIKPILTGDGWIHDTNANLLLPDGLYHSYSQQNALYDALREASVLFFSYERTRVGGSETKNSVPIKPLADIPDDDKSETKLTRASGGARMPVRDGFVISEQPEASPYGAFTAFVEVFRDIVVPLKAVDLGNGAVKPLKLALFVQLNLFGVAWTASTAA